MTDKYIHAHTLVYIYTHTHIHEFMYVYIYMCESIEGRQTRGPYLGHMVQPKRSRPAKRPKRPAANRELPKNA